ncbi:MAG: hypothetical protein ACI8TF_000404, partial [Paracoccaceae bacterium]
AARAFNRKQVAARDRLVGIDEALNSQVARLF